MSKTKNKVSRKSMEEALRAGCHVGVSGGVILRADHLGRVEGGRLNQIFGQAEHVEAAIVRDPAGFLTIAGMHHAINHGGSVMLNGEVISNIDDLPDEERLEALRAETADAVNASIDNQLALLTCAKANAQGFLPARRGRLRHEHDGSPAPGGPEGSPARPAGGRFQRHVAGRQDDGRPGRFRRDEETRALGGREGARHRRHGQDDERRAPGRPAHGRQKGSQVGSG
jgi:hypothetical protein